MSLRSRKLPGRALCALAAGVGVSFAAGLDSAEARPERSYRTHKVKRASVGSTRSAEKQAKEKAAPAPQVHLIVISIPKQRISLYGADGFHTQGAVSTGQSGFPTPTGVFSVIQKNRYHRSNIYSGAPMPFMQRITWSGVAMHEGVLPGYPASHGCIRLTHKFASELWGMTRMGVRVIVTPDDAQPAEVAHAALPAPNMTVAAADTARPSLVTVAATDKAPEGNDATPVAATSPAKLLSPLDRAKAERARTIAEAPGRAKAAKEAAESAASKAADANRAIRALREAEQAVVAARGMRETAAKAVEAAKTPEATERAKAALATAETAIELATKAVGEAVAQEALKTQEALAAAKAAWDAEKDSDAAAAVVRAGDRGTEPISIFVSRKTGRVYIRQAWITIHEAPVTFNGADTPLGTHVYVATDQHADGKGMRWLAVTYPQPSAEPDRQSRSGRRGDRDPQPAASHGRPRETPAGALDRVVLTDESKAFIADRLWAGASLIVSDYGLSNEFGKYTDFIVQPR
jgi:lipoprotein-anchoring transpeptidase ErfK/SrfK